MYDGMREETWEDIRGDMDNNTEITSGDTLIAVTASEDGYWEVGQLFRVVQPDSLLPLDGGIKTAYVFKLTSTGAKADRTLYEVAYDMVNKTDGGEVHRQMEKKLEEMKKNYDQLKAEMETFSSVVKYASEPSKAIRDSVMLIER